MRQAVLLMNDFVDSADRDLLAGFESWHAHTGRYSRANIKGKMYRDPCIWKKKYIVWLGKPAKPLSSRKRSSRLELGQRIEPTSERRRIAPLSMPQLSHTTNCSFSSFTGKGAPARRCHFLPRHKPASIRFNARPNRLTDSCAVVDDKNLERNPSENPFRDVHAASP